MCHRLRRYHTLGKTQVSLYIPNPEEIYNLSKQWYLFISLRDSELTGSFTPVIVDGLEEGTREYLRWIGDTTREDKPSKKL